MKYDVVKDGSIETMINEVNDLIKKGWIPLGGIGIDQYFWCQAMIKYESESNPTPKTNE